LKIYYAMRKGVKIYQARNINAPQQPSSVRVHTAIDAPLAAFVGSLQTFSRHNRAAACGGVRR